MLVDDSNEDWWKVLWQGGVQGEEGSDSCCSIFPSGFLQWLAQATPRANPWVLLSVSLPIYHRTLPTL